MTDRPEIYLDYAATSPVDPRVVDAMTACLTRDGAFGNPSSAHLHGAAARRVVEAARAAVAARVGAEPDGIVFTSGATEANNLALRGVLAEVPSARPHLVTTRIEHKSVLDTARALENRGVDVSYVACDARGVVAPSAVAEAMRPATVLVSVMHVNNETGIVQDVAAIAELCRERGVRFHVDAAQSAGKITVALDRWGVDLCSLTAHKACGPKGIGALYVRRGVELTPILFGGEQQRGLRPGTLATHQIAGFGKAFELADPAVEGPRLAALRERLRAGLERTEGVRVNGDFALGAPHILNARFPGIDGESLRVAIREISVSGGSACTADSPEASHVLSTMGLSDPLASSSVRFGVGRFTTEADIDRAVRRVAEEVARLRRVAGPAPRWCST